MHGRAWQVEVIVGTFEVGNLLQKLENLNFCLNFCQVYHTSNALGHMYGCSSQLETIVGTGSPHFTWFHITRFTLYTRLRFLPNEFTLCNTLHVFLTLHCQKYHFSSTSSTKLLCFTLHEFQFTRFIQKNKNRVKWGLPVFHFWKKKTEKIDSRCQKFNF